MHPAAAPQAEAVWTGLLSVTEGGEHVLRADTEGGEASVTVNGQDASRGVALTSGCHPLTIRFRRRRPRAAATALESGHVCRRARPGVGVLPPAGSR
ncbi:MAG: hypothetical protein IPM24_16840 [Bryobacterales bacterium]|nr:hypothetical protein [Bryobacterales bacterium]